MKLASLEDCLTNIKQLLDKVEHDIMNYQNRGLFYYTFFKQQAKEDIHLLTMALFQD